MSLRRWSDPSPHKLLFIEVEPGVRLEVLDWGGTGEPVFLLAGHGDTAHIFDNFAPELARYYHVFALTRRGFGASSQPKDDYNLPRLVEDILSVEDALKISKVNLVGHSIAGDEMDGFALRFPDRVRKLVYLEAAYDRVELQHLQATFPHLPASNGPSPADLSSPAAVTAYLRKTECPGFPESEVRATRIFGPDGHFERMVTPDWILKKLAAIVKHPDYADIHAPALALYAVDHTPAQLFQWYASSSPETQAALRKIFAIVTPVTIAQREQFLRDMRNGEVIQIAGANHFIFISNKRQVIHDVHRFLSEK